MAPLRMRQRLRTLA